MLAANPSPEEFSWLIEHAGYRPEAQGPNCEPAMRAYAALVGETDIPEPERTFEPELALGSQATLQPGEWQARTFAVPSQFLGTGCVLDVSIRSGHGERDFATRHIEIPLTEGFSEAAPRAIAALPGSKVVSEYVSDYEWYVIRLLAHAQAESSISVSWPHEALCSNGTASAALEAVPLISLPAENNQRVAAGQWATAGIALRAREGSSPPQMPCTAELTLTLADAQSGSSTTRLPVKLSRQSPTVTGSVVWQSCAGCKPPEKP